MCLSAIRKCKDSFFKRYPLQSGHFLIIIKSFNQSWVFSEPDSCWRFRKFTIPSYFVFHSVPSYFLEGTATGASEPYNINSTASAGNLAIGVERPTLKGFKSTSNCLNIQSSRYSPIGAMAPRIMLKERSGMTESSVISSTTPRPLQQGQAP